MVKPKAAAKRSKKIVAANNLSSLKNVASPHMQPQTILVDRTLTELAK